VSKFAPITSSLLERKSVTAPSVLPLLWKKEQKQPVARTDSPPRPRLVGRDDKAPVIKLATAPNSGAGGEDGTRHRISVSLSAREHETLGIVAVKRGLTRHQIVRDALDAHFAELSREFRTRCGCIATGCSCSNGGSDA